MPASLRNLMPLSIDGNQHGAMLCYFAPTCGPQSSFSTGRCRSSVKRSAYLTLCLPVSLLYAMTSAQ